jgi:MFS family permease
MNKMNEDKFQLPPEEEKKLDALIRRAGRQVVYHRVAMGFVLILGAVVGGFLADYFLLGTRFYFFIIIVPIVTLGLYIRDLLTGPSIQQVLQETAEEVHERWKKKNLK